MPGGISFPLRTIHATDSHITRSRRIVTMRRYALPLIGTGCSLMAVLFFFLACHSLRIFAYNPLKPAYSDAVSYTAPARRIHAADRHSLFYLGCAVLFFSPTYHSRHKFAYRPLKKAHSVAALPTVPAQKNSCGDWRGLLQERIVRFLLASLSSHLSFTSSRSADPAFFFLAYHSRRGFAYRPLKKAHGVAALSTAPA